MKASSWIRKMFEEGTELQKIHGAENVFDLSLGNPSLEPPAEFNEVLKRIVNEETPGTHRYMPHRGFPDVCAAVAKQLAVESGVPFTGADILMTVGAAGALNVILRSILDQDDEVVIIAPYFGEYVFYIQHQTGIVREAQSGPDFLPDIESLKANLSARTRAVIINTPNNPSGVIYPESVVAEIGAAIQEAEKKFGTEIYLVSDEPYRKLIYSDDPFPFIFKHHVRSVVATSHSKDLGLAGERIGHIAINPADPGKSDFMDAAIFAQRTLGFVNAPALMQRVVAEIQDVTVDVSEYRKKRDFMYAALTDIGYNCIKPGGAFFLFPESPIKDDVKFVQLLKSKLVLCVPGVGFGTPGYFRVSYCVENSVLEGSLKGFAEALTEAQALEG